MLLARRMTAAVDQPLLFVMLNARSVSDLLDKEQRFNRFFHSHHRVRIHAQASDHVALEHLGLDDSPARVESLFVLGLHLVLFEEIGCAGLSVSFPKRPAAVPVAAVAWLLEASVIVWCLRQLARACG